MNGEGPNNADQRVGAPGEAVAELREYLNHGLWGGGPGEIAERGTADAGPSERRPGDPVTDPTARLASALADRCVVERELGAGGLSPDGKRIAIQVNEPSSPNHDIWAYDIAQRTRTRLTFDQTAERPVWTPDGRRLVYSRGLEPSKEDDGRSGPDPSDHLGG